MEFKKDVEVRNIASRTATGILACTAAEYCSECRCVTQSSNEFTVPARCS